MTDGLDTLKAPQAGQSEPGGTGLLDVVHRRWLERTGGDDAFIASELSQQVASGEPDVEACVSLLDGHIVMAGREHAGDPQDEAAVYQAGRQVVQACIEESATTPEEPRLENFLDRIGAAFAPDAPPEEDAGSLPAKAGGSVLVPRRPRIRKMPRRQYRSSSPMTRSPQEFEALRDASLRLANQKRQRIAEIREGLRKGELPLAEALDDPDTEKVEIAKLIKHMSGVGRVKLRKTLEVVGLAPETEVGTLTDREKTQLATLLPLEKHQKRNRNHRQPRAQSAEALQRAQEVRLYRADLKRRLAARETTVAEVVEDEIGSGMALGEMLRSLPGRKGRSKNSTHGSKANELTSDVIRVTGLPSDKRCRDLTPRQRQMLLNSLADHGLG